MPDTTDHQDRTGPRPGPRWHQWAWFVGLWAAGVIAVSVLGLIIKLALGA